MSNEYKPKIIGSMSATATPTDNEVVERFMRTLKYQLLEQPPTFPSMKHANEFLQGLL